MKLRVVHHDLTTSDFPISNQAELDLVYEAIKQQSTPWARGSLNTQDLITFRCNDGKDVGSINMTSVKVMLTIRD